MPDSSDSAGDPLPRGCYPAMPTPFREDQSIDFAGVDGMADFYIEADVSGIFACGLSAEISWMDQAEQAQLAERIVKRTAGRVPIVTAAIASGPLASQADFVSRLHDVGSDVVAVSVCQLAEESQNDDEWIGQAEEFLKLVPDSVRLALYECPMPYWRLLSEQTIRWVAETGRFHFLKDTCCNIDVIRTRLDIVQNSPLQLFNANTETLLASLEAGADGFCGIGANYSPELYGWLCDHFSDQPELSRELQQFLDTTFKLTEGEYYPVSAKEYLRKRGQDIELFSRKLPASIPGDVVASLQQMRSDELAWLSRLAG